MSSLDDLKEEFIADAFEEGGIASSTLAERIIHDRKWAVAEIEHLRAIVAHRNSRLADLEPFWAGSKEELWGDFPEKLN